MTSRLHTDPKFLFASSNRWSPWAGSEELWFRAALALRKRGYPVAALIWRWDDDHYRILEKAGCQLFFRSTSSLTNRIRSKIQPNYDIRNVAAFKPSVAIISLSMHTTGADIAAEMSSLSIPYCTLVHSSTDRFWPDDLEVRKYRQMYENAQKNFFVAHRTIEDTETHLALKVPRNQVVSNPITLNQKDPMPWPDASKEIRLALVARLDPAQKGQDLAFKVLSQEKWRERPLRVSIAGTGPNASSLRDLARMYNLSNVEFIGHCEARALWQNHHGLLLPSRYEAQPLVILEAMHSGRICIATAAGDNRRFIEDGVNGFIAEYASVASIDEALERAWNQRDQWQAMAKHGKDFVDLHCSTDAAEAFADLCLHVVNT